MKAYTYRIGKGVDSAMTAPKHFETIYADSLGEAVDNAKSITKLRPVAAGETMVSIVEGAEDEFSLWRQTA